MIKDYKKCPYCGRLYKPDETRYCYGDGYPLIDYKTDNPIGEQLRHFDRPIAKPTYERPRKSGGTMIGESVMIMFFSMLFPPAGLLLAWIFNKTK